MSKSQHQVSTKGQRLCVDLYYPRAESNVNSVEISLVDVRAADSIRISYDFGRDGWKIEQASVFEWEADDTECDPGWQEVSFIQAWGLE